jgi:hypothetical protein
MVNAHQLGMDATIDFVAILIPKIGLDVLHFSRDICIRICSTDNGSIVSEIVNRRFNLVVDASFERKELPWCINLHYITSFG